jgi:hypothetical protein
MLIGTPGRVDGAYHRILAAALFRIVCIEPLFPRVEVMESHMAIPKYNNLMVPYRTVNSSIFRMIHEKASFGYEALSAWKASVGTRNLHFHAHSTVVGRAVFIS